MKRRALLAAALLSALAGCGTDKKASGVASALDLWCWPGGLGPQTVTAAVKQFPGLTTRIVDGDYLKALMPVLGGKPAPAIAGIKGEDVTTVLPRADLFVDLNTLGAGALRNEYLDWKWQQGSTLDNQLIGFPIDIGPTAMFYRADLFERAGLPGDPADVARQIPDWAAFLNAGTKLKARNVKLIANAWELFSVCCQQQSRRFVNESNQYVGDSAEIHTAWDIAVETIQRGLTAGIANDDKRWTGLFDHGQVATDSGAAWHAADMVQAAPATKSKWRVANGAADGANIGGSFLAVPANGGDHQTAFQVIKWLLSPENQARMFAEAALFPSAPAAYKMPELVAPDPFFGGQRTTEVFAVSAAKKKRSFQAPADEELQRVFADQLRALTAGSVNAATAWKTAVANGRAKAQSLGVLTQ
ncbi:ABC transporter substrate-binding protein [Actinoplanes sp. NPDC051411]|uniref:ABC transporter substrate-binding protein n=1 Tax=Actinoplanes sp. NPDC051411 TaxID=3155522 RepID=UPI00343AEE9D